MRRVTWIGLALLLAAAALGAQTPPALSETDQLRLQVNALKAQVLQLQLELTQCQAQAVSQQIQGERQELEQRLGPIDWQTLKPKSPATPSGGATPQPQVPKAPGSPSGGSGPPGV